MAAAAKKLATKSTSGVRLWPDMGPLGGMMASVPALVSGKLPSGYAVLLDAAAIALGSDAVALDRSEITSLQMDGAPGMSAAGGSPVAPTGMTTVSMFQTGSSALRAERFIAWATTRTRAVAALSGVSY
jgi:hypothetical protein